MIRRIVLDGGPGGGKSAGLQQLRQELQKLGYTIYALHEVATEAMTAGITPDTTPSEEFLQAAFFERGLQNETFYEGQLTQLLTASPEAEKGLLLCDRGLLSSKAFMDSEAFEDLVEKYGYSTASLLHRYDLAILIRSTAAGLPEVYERIKEDNPIRRESVSEALAADQRSILSWNGHPNAFIFGNLEYANFQEKLDAVVQLVRSQLASATPTLFERKFALPETFELASLQLPTSAVLPTALYQVYLDDQTYIRRVDALGSRFHFRVEKSIEPSIVRQRKETALTPREFLKLEQCRDPRFAPILKTRTFFVYQDQYFRLDTFSGALQAAIPNHSQILEILAPSPTQQPDLGEILDAVEVTDCAAYYNAEISRTAACMTA